MQPPPPEPLIFPPRAPAPRAASSIRSILGVEIAEVVPEDVLLAGQQLGRTPRRRTAALNRADAFRGQVPVDERAPKRVCERHARAVERPLELRGQRAGRGGSPGNVAGDGATPSRTRSLTEPRVPVVSFFWSESPRTNSSRRGVEPDDLQRIVERQPDDAAERRGVVVHLPAGLPELGDFGQEPQLGELAGPRRPADRLSASRRNLFQATTRADELDVPALIGIVPRMTTSQPVGTAAPVRRRTLRPLRR